ncbi:unnamed protein product [Phytomonas sp. Hart1]|nr:unnamed protein product [Phytomonas sp. Hart1]|eukprot:CCW71581.1 unnamed protein product [Phytomonas sp. isolate Hart1]
MPRRLGDGVALLLDELVEFELFPPKGLKTLRLQGIVYFFPPKFLITGEKTLQGPLGFAKTGLLLLKGVLALMKGLGKALEGCHGVGILMLKQIHDAGLGLRSPIPSVSPSPVQRWMDKVEVLAPPNNSL